MDVIKEFWEENGYIVIVVFLAIMGILLVVSSLAIVTDIRYSEHITVHFIGKNQWGNPVVMYSKDNRFSTGHMYSEAFVTFEDAYKFAKSIGYEEEK